MDMMARKVGKARIGVAFGVITALFLGVAGVAGVTPAQGASGSICKTGFRGDPAYDRACLSTGTREDAAVAWYVGYTDGQRAADCRSARRMGGLVNVVRETRGDVISDNFRNGNQMIRWTARMASADCRAQGVSVR